MINLFCLMYYQEYILSRIIFYSYILSRIIYYNLAEFYSKNITIKQTDEKIKQIDWIGHHFHRGSRKRRWRDSGRQVPSLPRFISSLLSFALLFPFSLSNRRSIASFLSCSYTLEGNVKSTEPFPRLLFLPGGRCPSLTDRPSAIFPLDVFGSRLIKCVWK